MPKEYQKTKVALITLLIISIATIAIILVQKNQTEKVEGGIVKIQSVPSTISGGNEDLAP